MSTDDSFVKILGIQKKKKRPAFQQVNRRDNHAHTGLQGSFKKF